MTKVDLLYKNTCEKIIDEYHIIKQRAVWGDGTQARTYHTFGVVNRYNLADGEEFPILTLRKINWKAALNEVLWIWQKHSNNVHDLKSHIWDSWADEKGSIGKAYGYQLGIEYEWDNGLKMNQVDKILWDLENNPTSRRIIGSMWNVEDLKDMNLNPCAYSMSFNVIDDKLNGILMQRSQDMFVAGNWNVVQYAILLMLFAKVTGFKTGELVHVMLDCHIYDRHVGYLKDMFHEPHIITKPVIIGKDVYFDEFGTGKEAFYNFTEDMFHINNYEWYRDYKNIEVAV